jgi:hypothetical protein
MIILRGTLTTGPHYTGPAIITGENESSPFFDIKLGARYLDSINKVTFNAIKAGDKTEFKTISDRTFTFTKPSKIETLGGRRSRTRRHRKRRSTRRKSN